MPKYDPRQLRADAPHKATATLAIRNAAGEKEVIETSFYYRGLSLDETGTFPDVAELKGKERIEVVKEQLARLIHSIPDFGVGPDDEQKPDAEYFGAMEDAHVDAFSDAIQKDREVPQKPSNS